MRKKIIGTDIFAFGIVILTIVYFALPSDFVQKISLKKPSSPIVTQQIPKATASEFSSETNNFLAIPTNLGKTIKIPVLMYHHVADISPEERTKDPVESDLTVSVADFEAQVKYFHDLGYRTITVQQLYDALANQGDTPPKPIIFTFDDGYADVFANAIPILQKYNYTGSFAIATDLLGRPGYAVWKDVMDADKSNMEILNHTENHLDLTSKKYSPDDLHREIFDAKAKLEGRLGHPVNFFVYPYGHYNYNVALMVSSSGHKMAFTTSYGMYESEGQLFSEPRVRVHGENGLDKLKLLFEPKRSVPVQSNP